MSLNLRRWESSRSGLLRIADCFAGSAECRIDRPGSSRAEDLHEMRLCIKRMRAMWRLLRPSIYVKIYQRENAGLRDVAIRLAKFRDDDVMGATLQSLATKTTVKKLRTALQELEREIAPAPDWNQDLESALHSAGKAMLKSSHALGNLTIEARGWLAFSPGLNLSYRRACKSFHRVAQLSTDEQFHVWRKRVKDLLYQLEILLPAWPQRSIPRHRKLKDLAAMLGEHHDLAVLRQRITDHLDRDGARNSCEPVHALVTREIGKLSIEAILCGNSLFNIDDKEWIERLHQHWLHWRR